VVNMSHIQQLVNMFHLIALTVTPGIHQYLGR